VLGQLKGLFTLDIHEQIGSGVYCLFGGLFTLYCGHNPQVSSLKKHLVFVKIYMPMKLRLDSSYYLTLRRMVYVLSSMFLT